MPRNITSKRLHLRYIPEYLHSTHEIALLIPKHRRGNTDRYHIHIRIEHIDSNVPQRLVGSQGLSKSTALLTNTRTKNLMTLATNGMLPTNPRDALSLRVERSDPKIPVDRKDSLPDIVENQRIKGIYRTRHSTKPRSRETST
jgi:hypothetical protein